MSEPNDLDCKIYVDASTDRSEIVRFIAALLSAPVERYTILAQYAEFDVRLNDDFDEVRRTEFPDGFLHFRFLVEVYCRLNGVLECRRATLGILESLWSHTFPAVAACDYEAELPERGGYGSRTIPWPSPAETKGTIHLNLEDIQRDEPSDRSQP